MSSSRKRLVAAVLALAAGAAVAQSAAFQGIGRPATPKELAAWDIDVRPDFKGLPKGSGSVAQGMDIWEAKCASCHGIFGESNEIFTPLVGGTTKDDVKTGRVARLLDESFPGRTTLMKVPTISTLWDYIHRAMPWNAPKSLKPDEVYALTAFMLNLGGVLPDDFTLDQANLAAVQKRLPNRNGMTTAHGMWPGAGFGNGKPDVKAVACMKNCATEATVASYLPDHARNAHGNLAEQNRAVGAQHGADTTRAPGAAPAGPATPKAAPVDANAAALTLARKFNCLACHGMDTKLVGPGLREVSKKYAGRADAADYLAQRISAGGSGVWGSVPMPAQAVPAADLKALAQWIAQGAKP
jgi:cytochrome c